MPAYSDQISLYDNHCVVYTRTNSKKGVYQARMTFPGKKGYVRKSLKTTSRTEAIATAQKLYLTLRARVDQKIPIDTTPWLTAAKIFLDTRFNSRDHRSSEYEYIFDNWLNPFFGHFEDVTEIASEHVSQYWDFRINYWQNHDTTVRASLAEREVTNKKPFSKESARREAIVLRRFFDFLFSRGYVGAKPIIQPPRSIKSTDNSRGRFSIQAYRLLLRRLEGDLRKKPSPDRLRYYLPRYRRLQRLRYWILLLASSGMRPQEAKLLKQHQIVLETDKDTGTQFTRINLYKEQSKQQRGARTILTFDNEANYNYYQRYLAVLADYDPSLIGGDKWVFPSFRNKNNFFDPQSAFKILLKTYDLYRDDEGKARSSYSLRSFYISRRLESGCPLYTVAHNAGTSYDQIYKHYASSLTWTMRHELTRNNPGARRQVASEPQPEAKDIFTDLADNSANFGKLHT